MRLIEKIIVDTFIFLLLVSIVLVISIDGFPDSLFKKKTAKYIDIDPGMDLSEAAEKTGVSPVELSILNSLDIFSEKTGVSRLILKGRIRPDDKDRFINKNIGILEKLRAAVDEMESELINKKSGIEKTAADIKYYRTELKYPNQKYVNSSMIEHYNGMVESHSGLAYEYQALYDMYRAKLDELNGMVEKYNRIIELDKTFLKNEDQ